MPAALWAIFRDRSTFIEKHARRSLNFQLVLLPVYILASAVAFILPIGFIGSLLQFAVFVFSAIFAIQGAIAAYNRQQHSYPIDVDIVKKH